MNLEPGDRVEITWPRGEGRWRGWFDSYHADENVAWVRMEPGRRPVDDFYMEWDPTWVRKLSILELLAEAAE